MGTRYDLIRVLGHGGMSTVYLARDVELDRHVALKVLASNLAGDGVCRARFLREAKLASHVSHPSIVRIYGVGEDERGPFIVMEHVEGPTLASELARRGSFSPEQALEVAVPLASALAAAHAAGLVHRDVTPQNVLLDRKGSPKLSDFGIARLLDGTRFTERGTIMGTAAYLAPEQARGEVVTSAADVYSLGAVLYELLTGRPPFQADTLPALLLQCEEAAVVPPRDLAPAVSPALEALVLRTLEKAPESRPSAAALAATLPASLDASVRKTRVLGPPAATRVIRRPLARGRFGEERRAVVAVAALCAVALLAAGVVRATGSGAAASDSTAPQRPSFLAPVISPPPPSSPRPVRQQPPPAPAPTVTPRTTGHGKGKKKGHKKHGRAKHDQDAEGNENH
jgi:serine/threonine-protein kinase